MANPRICSIPDCGKRHKAKGFCGRHYQSYKKHGDPLASGPYTPRGEPLRFIYEVVLHHAGDGCLTWPYAENGYGYGVIQIDGRVCVVNRYVCELVNGPPPTPCHEAAHSCGRGHEGCISPSHLRWATRKENFSDKIEHGTHNRGAKHNFAKLSEDDVREIRRLKGTLSQREIGRKFGIKQGQVSRIQCGTRWSSLE